MLDGGSEKNNKHSVNRSLKQ